MQGSSLCCGRATMDHYNVLTKEERERLIDFRFERKQIAWYRKGRREARGSINQKYFGRKMLWTYLFFALATFKNLVLPRLEWMKTIKVWFKGNKIWWLLTFNSLIDMKWPLQSGLHFLPPTSSFSTSLFRVAIALNLQLPYIGKVFHQMPYLLLPI